jgi:hypothetical protein
VRCIAARATLTRCLKLMSRTLAQRLAYSPRLSRLALDPESRGGLMSNAIENLVSAQQRAMAKIPR